MKHKVAAGAYLFQVYHPLQQGIDPHRDFEYFGQASKQSQLLLAVRDRKIDAVFIRSGLLEKYSEKGELNLDDFIVVDERTSDGLKLKHTTDLYPEWSLSVSGKMSLALAAKVKESVLKLSPDSLAAKAANIVGFVDPASHDQLRNIMEELKIPPFDK